MLKENNKRLTQFAVLLFATTSILFAPLTFSQNQFDPGDIDGVAEYEAAIHSADLVIIEYGATWCGPCQKFKKDLAEIQAAFPDARFYSFGEYNRIGKITNSLPEFQVFTKKILASLKPFTRKEKKHRSWEPRHTAITKGYDNSAQFVDWLQEVIDSEN
jgi:thiol-disulfide isomerase/thioredoxin